MRKKNPGTMRDTGAKSANWLNNVKYKQHDRFRQFATPLHDYLSADDVARALGFRRSGQGYTGTCPACGYRDACAICQGQTHVLVHCHACRDRDAILDALRQRDLWHKGRPDTPLTRRPHTLDTGARKRAEDDTARKSELARAIWRQSVQADGTLVATYLLSRAIIGPVPPTLRYHAGLEHAGSGQTYPAMVAGVTVWPSRTILAVHRTFLGEDGRGKAPVDNAKMTLGPIRGGAVRLAPVGPVLAIAEGIETALSVQVAAGIPAWACLSTGGMQAVILPPPDTVPEVVVCADGDKPGQRAALDAAERLTGLGHRVRLAFPHDADMNDLLREAAHVG